MTRTQAIVLVTTARFSPPRGNYAPDRRDAKYLQVLTGADWTRVGTTLLLERGPKQTPCCPCCCPRTEQQEAKERYLGCRLANRAIIQYITTGKLVNPDQSPSAFIFHRRHIFGTYYLITRSLGTEESWGIDISVLGTGADIYLQRPAEP